MLMDVAKNISNLIVEKRNEYNKNQSKQTKSELIKLLNDRKELYLFNTNII